jgi:hypothetical protein
MKFLQMVDGNKTYICAIGAAVFTLIHFFIVSDYSLSSFIVLSQQATIVAAVAALRHGIAKVGNQGVITTGGQQ